jgi:RHS repeat-associated protein
MWQMRNGEAQWVQSKHIYVGETRIGTKYNSEGNENTGAEKERIYYYHSDHLGSAQVVTNHAGQLYERLEYTPYGETWIEWRNAGVQQGETTPYRFTGKERDAETGLYYYGARYLDPKTSRWLSVDPAMGEYIPGAPISDEARQRNGNLPGQGGVFNLVNLHVYHYAGNNPVKYTDPDGRYLLYSRKIDKDEAALVKKMLGVDAYFREISVSVYSNLPMGRSASLPGGRILLDKKVTPTMGSSKNKGVFIHEFYHQIQYIQSPLTAWSRLEEEQTIDFLNFDDPYSYGSYEHGNDLGVYSTIHDIPYLEGQAQLVEEFTFLYDIYENGGYLSDIQKKALKEQARILKNSDYKSEAINTVLDNL